MVDMGLGSRNHCNWKRSSFNFNVSIVANWHFLKSLRLHRTRMLAEFVVEQGLRADDADVLACTQGMTYPTLLHFSTGSVSPYNFLYKWGTRAYQCAFVDTQIPVWVKIMINSPSSCTRKTASGVSCNAYPPSLCIIKHRRQVKPKIATTA